MSSDRFGGGDSPSARRRARRRRLAGLEPQPERSGKSAPRVPGSLGRTPPPRKRATSPVPDHGSPPPAAPSAAPAAAAAEQRDHRPWFEWRGWDSVVTYVVLATMLAGVVTGLHRLLAAGVFVIGASALVWAITHRPGHRRGTSGYGVLLDWLMATLPRPVYLVLCVLVLALGVVGVIAG